MSKRKDETLRDFVREQLKDSQFREAYQEATLALGLAKKITTLRKRLRMTQSELARRMGTKQQAISRLSSPSISNSSNAYDFCVTGSPTRFSIF